MVCPKCGIQIADGARFCPKCGSPTSTNQQANNQQQSYGQQFSNVASNMFNQAEDEIKSAINDVQKTFSGNNQGGFSGNNQGGSIMKERLKDDRGLVSYILLSIVTCGIYGYYFLYQMAHDVNIACDGDGENTAGLVQFIVLSIVTCGIYSFFWQYQLGNRLANNASRYGMSFQENGTTVLMWDLFGAILCGIGPYVAMNILIKNSNSICAAYNQQNGL